MESWSLRKRKSWLNWSLMLMMIHLLMVWQTQEGCIEEGRKTLLQVKASHMKSFDSKIDQFLPNCIDIDSSTPGDGGSECCDWERVSCNSTIGLVTDLSLYNFSTEDRSKLWALNASLFLHFKELMGLNLSLDFLDNGIMKTGLERLSSLKKLEVLDLSWNDDIDKDILPSLSTLTSLKTLDLSRASLNGNFPANGLCELKNLHELDLSGNMIAGTLLQCLENLSSLKLLDISSTRFTGIIVPSLIANLTSLEYIDFSRNKFEGSFSFSSFFNHTKLEVVRFQSDNDKFEVEIEDPIDWIPMFQLQVLELLNCIKNRPTGLVVPGFLFHQHKLRELHLPANSLEGHFPNWLIKNNTNLEFVILRNNLFGSMPLYKNPNMKFLDMSGNYMIGNIPDDIPNFFPNIHTLNLSRNALSGAIPCSIGDLSLIDILKNSVSASIPTCLQNITHPSPVVFLGGIWRYSTDSSYHYGSTLWGQGSYNICEPPLEKKCPTTISLVMNIEEDTQKWYDIDMTCFYGSISSTCLVFLLGYVASL